MESFSKLLAIFSLISSVFGSENGGYYICDVETLASENQCVFALSGDEPDDWVALEEHSVDRDVGPDFYRGVEKYDGSKILGASPLPWTNGDRLVGTDEKVSGDDWNGYTLIFELMAPLRDMMMFTPDVLIQNEELWNMYTRALTDCNAKTEDYVASRAGGIQYSTSQIYDIMSDPKNKDIHHNVLQFLEEGSIDLVCLSTDLEMDHCDVTRDAAGSELGDHCNCWFDAYQAIYGECPVVDSEFKHCEFTTAPTVCTDATPNAPDDGEGTDTGTDDKPSGPPDDMPSPPDKPDGPPS